MPLIKGKSQKSFEHNLKAEMHAGKPMKQSLAIAYAMKRKAKKMADGGMADGGMADVSSSHASSEVDQSKKPVTTADNPVLQSVRKAFKFAEGGYIGSHQSPKNPHMKDGLEEPEHELASGYVDHMGNDVKHNEMAIHEDDRMLNQHGADEEGPDGVMMAMGGEAGHQSEAHEMDMIDHVMKHRMKHYSEGGRVANSGEDDLDKMADGRPNNFDDLSLRDDLESSYTGANSGDELGDAREDHDRADIIAKIMASRRKKDRLPRPA